MTDLIGKTFGNYKLVELIGKGGMASVYRGYQESIDRSVAVKTLAVDAIQDATFLTRFFQEARTLAKLTHPSVLPLYDFGNAGGVLYIVMPLMTGGTLAERLTGGPLPISEVIRIFLPIAQALDFAHNQGIVHRDIKPSNILFDQRNTPFLADFGIAKTNEPGSSLTGTGVIGTPDYMSPEQARGEALDRRSDIYSLGVVAFQSLTGQPLFTASTPMGVIFKHISEAPRSPREAQPDLPAGVDAVIQKALAKDPAQRYQTATEFANALVAALEPATRPVPPPPLGDPRGFQPSITTQPLAGPPTIEPVKQGGLFNTRNIVLALAAGGLCLVCSICSIVFVIPALMPPSPTATEIVLATPTPEPTRTPQVKPTATRPPTRTPTAEPVAVGALGGPTGPSILLDSFDDNGNRWPAGKATGELADATRDIADGKYTWTVEAKNDVTWRINDGKSKSLTDFYAAVDGRRVSGNSQNRYALAFRDDGDNYYLFTTGDAGQFAVFLWYNGNWETLIDWTNTAAIRPGEANRLAVLAQGSHFEFFINGETVGEADDDRLRQGLVGIAAEVVTGGETGVFEYDNFELREVWPSIFADNFDSNASDWNTGESDSDYLTGSQKVADGKYHWEARAKQGVFWSGTPKLNDVSDFYFTTQARQVSGPKTAAYGVVFRWRDDDNFYYFRLADDGTYSFYAQVNNDWKTLIDSKGSTAIRPGEVNQITVEAIGPRFAFFVNGQKVDEYTDQALERGIVGLGVELNDQGDEGVFEFDNVEVRTP
jgi:serine/threonine-protein kinase